VKNIIDDTRKRWNKILWNMDKSGTHDNELWNYCVRNGGDLVYYFYMSVNLHGGPDSIKERIQVDLTKDVFFCSVKDASETMPTAENSNDRIKRSKQSNLKVLEAVSKTSEEQIKVQCDLAEQKHKIQLAIADKLANQQMANANMIAQQISMNCEFNLSRWSMLSK